MFCNLYKTKFNLIFFFTTFVNFGIAQDIMMQGWYWDYPKGAWASTLTSQANALGIAGFTDIWVPPLARASFGNNSNGYDPKDLYDYGEYGGGATGVGTRSQVNTMIAAFNSAGINTIADMIYNHRDGGKAESNNAVKEYITNYYTAAKEPFPSDRVRMAIPLGGASGNGASDYYIKVSSKTGNSRFAGKNYNFYCWTNKVGFQNLTDVNEVEPNGGGDCNPAQSSSIVQLGVNYICNLDIGNGCNTDEFKLSLASADYFSTDTLFISLINTNGYADQRIYGIWQATLGQNIVNQLQYQTYTNFNNLPSGQGAMNFENFKPNSANAPTTYLNGDWDSMLFFYDYDQNQLSTKNELNAWTKWNWDNVGIRGFRMDAVKHFPPTFITQLNAYLASNGISPKIFVGEYFDLSATNLRNWVNSVPSNVRTFDFSLRDAFKKASDCFGYDVRNIFNEGMVGYPNTNAYKYRAITFVNNHDLREGLSGNGGCSGSDYNTPIQNDPMLAYAYILTNNQLGIPCIYYPDYYGVSIPNAPTSNLKIKIDSLIRIHKDYIFGAPNVEYLSRIGTTYGQSFVQGQASTTLAYQIHGGIGGKDIMVAINYSGTPLDMYQVINTSWGGGAGTTYKNLIGNAPIITNITSNNELHIEVPPRSYSVWVREATFPVELVSFRADIIDKKVGLHWNVATEKNLEKYELERMVDGSNFLKIGEIKAANLNTYSYEDNSPIYDKTMYYRLAMKDLDGKIKYSNICQIKIESQNTAIKLFPNPAFSKVYMIENNMTDAEWIVFNNIGEKVISWHGIFPENGLDISNFNRGVFYIKFINNSENHILKFIKQ
jgi:Alpha amylase, catalytic domain